MLLTEEQARKQWCPFSRLYSRQPSTGDLSGGWNRYLAADEGEPRGACCIASDCMAWRWANRDEILVPEGAPLPDGYFAFGTVVWSSKGEKQRWQVARLVRKSADGEFEPMRGSCGLAGKAET